MSTDKHERWIVGLDLSARSHGALVFAAWMRQAESPAERPSLVGVHVLEAWAAHYLPVGREEYVRSVRAVAERHMAEVGGAFDDVQVVEAERAEDGLVGAAQRGDAIVIGRSATRESHALVRLGRVARRVLRQLPAPVFVVPPDLSAQALGGPVVLAVDLTDSCVPAIEAAVRLARAHGRPLVLAHAGEPRHADLLDELDPRWLAAREQFRGGVEREFAAWAEAKGLGAVRRVLEYGSAPETLARIAAREQAAVIVVGSRRLSTAERIFTTSTASALAGLCTCPVAVVPPREP